MSDSSFKLRLMIITALFAAIISVLAQVVIPLHFGVPITGQTLDIGLAATILGSRLCTCATLLYLIIGSVGMPVFAQFTGGLVILIGPTGVFLVGFVPAVFIMGYYLEKTSFTITNALIANIIGMFIDRKSTRLNSSHVAISYAVFCLKKKNKTNKTNRQKYRLL